MKQFSEFLPIALFAGVYFYTRDIYISTAVLMVGLGVQLVVEFVTTRTVERKTLVIFAIAVVFGGATLAFRDQTFIQWKPTVVNWLFSGVLLGSQFVGERNMLERMLGSQLDLPRDVWRTLNLGWAGGFFLAGVANLVVAYQFSLDFWVSYKLVGGFAITFLYVAVTIVYLARGGYLKDEPAADEATPPEQT